MDKSTDSLNCFEKAVKKLIKDLQNHKPISEHDQFQILCLKEALNKIQDARQKRACLWGYLSISLSAV